MIIQQILDRNSPNLYQNDQKSLKNTAMCNLLPECRDKRLKNSKIRGAKSCRPGQDYLGKIDNYLDNYHA